MQPLSYALKTWKDRKGQFITRNKIFIDTQACTQRAEVVQKVLHFSPWVRLCIWGCSSYVYPHPTTLLGFLDILHPPPLPQTHALSSSFWPLTIVSILFSLEGVLEFLVFQILRDKEKLSLLHQPQSETLTGQISLPLGIQTTLKRLTVNVCPSHPSLSVILDCRRRRPEKGAAKVASLVWESRSGKRPP